MSVYVVQLLSYSFAEILAILLAGIAIYQVR